MWRLAWLLALALVLTWTPTANAAHLCAHAAPLGTVANGSVATGSRWYTVQTYANGLPETVRLLSRMADLVVGDACPVGGGDIRVTMVVEVRHAGSAYDPAAFVLTHDFGPA